MGLIKYAVKFAMIVIVLMFVSLLGWMQCRYRHFKERNFVSLMFVIKCIKQTVESRTSCQQICIQYPLEHERQTKFCEMVNVTRVEL